MTSADTVELPRHLRRTLGLLAPRRVELDARVRVRPWSSAWLLTHPEDVQHVLVTGAERYGKTPFLTSAEGRRRAGQGLLTSSGEEHLRQHNERLTGTDQDIEREALQWAAGPPAVAHLLRAR